MVDDLVYVANDSEAESSIVGFDAQDGRSRWRILRKSGTTAFATPCLLGSSVRTEAVADVSTASGLTARSIRKPGKSSGKALKDDIPQRCVGSPIVAGGMVFMSCGQGGNGKC